MGIDVAKKHAERQEFVPLAHPQCSVDAMADQFPDTTPVPGVTDVRAANAGR